MGSALGFGLELGLGLGLGLDRRRGCLVCGALASRPARRAPAPRRDAAPARTCGWLGLGLAARTCGRGKRGWSALARVWQTRLVRPWLAPEASDSARSCLGLPRSFGQPRPISRLGPAQAPRPHRAAVSTWAPYSVRGISNELPAHTESPVCTANWPPPRAKALSWPSTTCSTAVRARLGLGLGFGLGSAGPAPPAAPRASHRPATHLAPRDCQPSGGRRRADLWASSSACRRRARTGRATRRRGASGYPPRTRTPLAAAAGRSA